MKNRKPIWILVIAAMVLVVVLEAGALYKMLSAVINGESPRQVSASGPAEPLDLTGEWMQTNTPDGHRRQVLRITEDTIEIYWAIDADASYSLYWSGSYTPPSNAREPYRWTSVNDTERTGASPLGTSDAAKDFTYQDGKLTYAAGENQAEAERSAWGYEEHILTSAAAAGPTGIHYEESGDIGDYHIEIGGAVVSTDTTGAPAVIVTYSWTNNSEATASAMVMLIERAYQDGVQLVSTQIDDTALYDAASASRATAPGGTTLVQRAFQLAGSSKNLTFEVSEFLSHTKDAVTKEYDLTALR